MLAVSFEERQALFYGKARRRIHLRLIFVHRRIIPGRFQIRFINARGRFESSLEAMRKYLRRSRVQRVLVAAVNDPICLGGLTAFEETGRMGECLAVSHTGTLRTRRELRRAGSNLIGAVGYFPERYGETIIRLAVDRLQRRQVPSATFIKHHLLSQENVDHFYPNDVFLIFLPISRAAERLCNKT